MSSVIPIPSERLINADLIGEYEPSPSASGYGWPNYHINPNRPRFVPEYIPMMMRDPRLRIGIKIIKGAIQQNIRFDVRCSDNNVGQFVTDQLERFKLRGLSSILDSLWFGHSSHEVFYRQNELGQWEYDRVKRIAPGDARIVTVNGNAVGMNVYRALTKQTPIYVPFPKALWAVHQRTENVLYGRPAIFGAFEPWWETWCPHGYRDTRSLWFFKNAFSGPSVRYPPGSTPIDRNMDGTVRSIPNKTLADEIVDKMRTGSGCSIPAASDTVGQWDVERGESQPIPDGLLMYGDDLANEKLEGLGVPPEIIAADGSGAFAGRAIPMQAFNCGLHDTASEPIDDIRCQCLEPLVRLNGMLGHWNPDVKFDVLVTGFYESNPYAQEMDDSGALDEEGNPFDESSGDPSDPQSSPGDDNSGGKPFGKPGQKPAGGPPGAAKKKPNASPKKPNGAPFKK